MSTRGLRKWALLLTFWLALHSKPLRATDQTVSGDLTVTGTSDFQGDSLTFGMRSDTSDPGIEMVYTDGSTSILEFNASRSANIWKWQQNGGSALTLQMSLDENNALRLYDQSSTPEPRITLDPLGTSTFENSIVINGTDNQMPYQTLTGESSVLTEGLADARYLSNASSTVSLFGGTATGVNSIAWGPYAVADGVESLALGIFASASGDGSTAIGYNSTASANSSVAIGGGTTASATCSVAIGGGTTASANYSTAMGYYSTANGYISTAMGKYSIASGDYSTAVGLSTIASGYASTAMGWGSNASGFVSTVMGDYSNASGDGSTAMGLGTNASGNASVAMGCNSNASGFCSTTMGYSTTASAYLSFVAGRYNVGGGEPTTWVGTDPLFEIGNGIEGTYLTDYAPTRSDALVVYKNGDTAVQGNLSAGGVITAQPGGDIPMYTGH